MAQTEAKLKLSLDDIIAKSSKTSKGNRAGGDGKPAAGRWQRNGASKGPAGGAKARALGVAVGKSNTKRQAVAPRRVSGGSVSRRQISIDADDGRMSADPRRPRLDRAEVAKVTAALEGSGKWQHDKFEGGAAAGRNSRGRPESGYKLVITNLDYKVSDDDVKELFQSFGTLKRAGVVYDNSGRSEETAEVVFLNKQHALAAMTRYNNVSLDGKPMHIELVEAGAGRIAERLSSGIRLGDRLGDRLGRGAAGNGRRVVTAGSGAMRSAQGGRRTGRRTGGDFMEE